MFNFNVDTVDLGAYYRGLNQYNAGQAQQQALDMRKNQMQQQAQQVQQIQSLSQAALSGDPKALQQLAAIDPARASQVQQFQQSQQPALPDMKALGDDLSIVQSLAKSGSPMLGQTLGTMLQKYQGTGFDNEILSWAQQYDQDPQAAISQLDETVNAFQPKSEPKTGRYVRERMGDELAIIDSATGQVVRKYPIPQSKKEQAELAKKTADIKKAENEAQLKVLAAESEEEKRQASIDMANEAAVIARELANDPNLNQAVGTVDTWLPTVRESTQDVINKAQRLESLLTVDNLKLMSGVLTDRDIAFLTRVASGLNITDSGIKGSESAVKKRLTEIADKIEGSVAPQRQAAPQSSGEVNWADL